MMKYVTAVEVYHILKDLLISGMSGKGQRAILKNLRILKPLAEDYVASVQEAQEKMKPVGFDEIEKKANAHNEAVKNNSEEGLLSGEELKKVSAVYDLYNRNINSYVNELGEEIRDISVYTLEEEDFDLFLSANNKNIEAGKWALLDEVLCPDQF